MHIQGQVNDLCTRFDLEVQNKAEIKQANREKMFELSDKMTGLQDALNDARQQIVLFKDTECALRDSIKQKDEEIHSLTVRVRYAFFHSLVNSSTRWRQRLPKCPRKLLKRNP